MRFCIITPNVIKGDGQGRANYEVAREALRRGHELAIVASRIDPAIASAPRVESVTIATARQPLQMLYDLEFRHRSAEWLRVHRRRFDVVMSNGAATSAPADVTAAQFTHHGWWNNPFHIWRTAKTPYGLYQLLYTTMGRRMERAAFLSSRWSVAVSSQIKRELIEVGVPEGRIVVIYNGADIDEFKPGRAERAELGLPLGVPLFAFVGDLRLNRKNLGTVLKALVQVRDAHLAVAGDLRRSPYPAMAAELAIDDRVHFLGKRLDIAAIMRSCDAFVFPSHYEGFCLSVVEAMASGLPVIVSRHVGTSEIITPECGIVLRHAADPNELAAAIRSLIDSPALRREMGAAARCIATAHAWPVKAAQYLDFLEAVG